MRRLLIAALAFALCGPAIAESTFPPTPLPLSAANGGAGTVNGALKGNGAGAVSQAACADLSNATGACSATYTASGSWTPADNSGASLSFAGVSAHYTQIGNMVFAYGNVTYPTTANSSGASISGLPIALANAAYSRQCFVVWANAAVTLSIIATQNATTFAFSSEPTGAGATNANLSAATVIFQCIYPVS
ncbi:hypothetical protein SAMN05519103_00350 [Rhizobiales bacterium GAS113]|nr:hypothetical protein SAMN05519103_00350 [Rhizobiales bacterium GAS113]